MGVTLLKVTNIGLKITDTVTIPIIKAVIKTDTQNEAIDNIVLNSLIDEIYSRSIGFATVSTVWNASIIEPFHSNLGNWAYGVESSFRFWGNNSYIGNTATFCDIKGLTYQSPDNYIARPLGLSGYSEWTVCHAILFVDENNNLYTFSNWINITPLYDSNPGITDIDGKIAVAVVQSGYSLRPLLTGTQFTHTTYDITNDIVNEIDPEITDPYNPGGESGTGGGTGDFDGTSDPIDFPSLPSISATDTGFITLFNPSLAELKSLAAYMWDGSLFDISTFQKLFADPMDAILGLSIVPVSVPNGGQTAIKVGNVATPINMNKAATQYIEVDCGTLNINEFWGAYLDYAPYTRAEIYLPYCGTHAINIDDIMSKSVHVKYHVDILSGACCAYVKCGDSVLYQFSGQCSSSIPISGTDFTQMINGVLSAAVSIGSMVATGGASAPLAIPSLANTAVNSMKPSIEKSGAISGTSGMLAIQKPYMILTRPKQALPSNQNKYTGYPSYITVSLGDISGYTEIENIHLEGVSGTDSELDEIVTLLKSGVIL